MYMRKFLALAILLLAISNIGAAQTVTLSIARLGCGSPASPFLPPPASTQEREQVSAEWVGSDELDVDSWDDETAGNLVDPNSVKVRLDGNTLTVSYAHRQVALDRSKPVPACLSAVKLFFIVSGLPKSHYELRIEDGHGIVRPLTIDG